MKMSRFSNEENTVQSNRNCEIAISLTFNRTLIISLFAIKYFRELRVYSEKKMSTHFEEKLDLKALKCEAFLYPVVKEK